MKKLNHIKKKGSLLDISGDLPDLNGNQVITE